MQRNLLVFYRLDNSTNTNFPYTDTMRAFMRWLPYAVLPALLIVTSVVFLRSIDADFVVWDDLALIVNNPMINGFHLEIFWTFDPELFAPLALLTFQFEHWLTGFEPTLFHATNLLLHLINTFLVWKVLNALSKRGQHMKSIWILSAIATTLFALHPVQVETVAWVSGRKELLWTLFGLLALLNHMRDAGQSPQTLDQYLPQKYQTLLYIFFALLSKPTAVVLPLFIIILDARTQSFRSTVIRHRYALLLALIFGILALFGKSDTDVILTIFQRIALLCAGLVYSIRLVLWPAGFAALHPAPEPVSLLSLPYAAACTVTIVIAIAWWRLRSRMGRANIAGGFFLLALLPGLLSPVHAKTVTTMSEHYLYFPMTGIAFLALLIMEKIAPKLQSSKKRFLGLSCLLGILGFLCISTYSQVSVWRDSASLFASVRKLYPRSVAVLTNLGTAYAQIGMYGEAESVLRQAISIEPDAIQARFNYAGLYYVKGNYERAIKEYKEVLELAPLHQDALRLLTWSYYYESETNLARETYDIVIHLNPSLRSELPMLDTPPPERGSM